jgi:hypothetical protein
MFRQPIQFQRTAPSQRIIPPQSQVYNPENL